MRDVEKLTKKLIEARNKQDLFAVKMISTILLQNISEDDIIKIRETISLEEETECLS